jgi:hypothetical protein
MWSFFVEYSFSYLFSEVVTDFVPYYFSPDGALGVPAPSLIFFYHSRWFGVGRLLFFCSQFDLGAPRGLAPARFSLPAQAQAHGQKLRDARFSLGVSQSKRPHAVDYRPHQSALIFRWDFCFIAHKIGSHCLPVIFFELTHCRVFDS